jgi:hypothetical protein
VTNVASIAKPANPPVIIAGWIKVFNGREAKFICSIFLIWHRNMAIDAILIASPQLG